LGKQEQILLQMGPENPLCDLDQYSYTLGKLVELAGWSNTTSFFHDTSQMDPQQKQTLIQQMMQHMQQAAQKGKSGPDPQVEMAKIKSQERQAMMKMQLETMHANADRQLEAMKIKGDLYVAMMNAMSDHSNEQTRTLLQGIIDHASNQMDAAVGMHSAGMGAAIDHHNNMVGHAKDLQIAQMQDDTARYAAQQQGQSNGGSN
jgi:hypothetical protein